MKSDAAVRIFLLSGGNMLAMLLALLALETTLTNFLGWFLFASAIAYGAGGVVYLWRNREGEDTSHTEKGNRCFWYILPGFRSYFLRTTARISFPPAFVPRGIALELTGLIIILAGLTVRIWTRTSMGDTYSGYLHVRAGHLLLTDGPYYLVRHPGYTGFVIIALGLCIGYSSLIGLAGILFLLLPGLAYRIKVEECLQTEKFGEEYRAYIRKSKKLIPGVW